MQNQQSARHNTLFNANSYSSNTPFIVVRPYFEKKLDRQKFALLIPLFLLLIAGAVYRQRSWSSWMPQTPPVPFSEPFVDASPPESQAPESNDLSTATISVEAGLDDAIAVQTDREGGAQVGTEAAITAKPSTPREYSAIQPLPTYGEKGQAPSMPVTLSKPAPGQTITQDEATMFQGTAAAGSKVLINHGQSTGRRADGLTVYQTGTIGEVQASADGRWQLSIPTPLPAGEHQLSVTQIDAQNGMQMTFTPVNFTVLSAGTVAQSDLMPIINSPQTGSRLSVLCTGGGSQRFSGTAMSGWVIQLLLNEQPAGETRVGINQAWELAVAQPLTTGSYIGRVVLMSPGGEVAAESSPVAFAIYPCQ